MIQCYLLVTSTKLVIIACVLKVDWLWILLFFQLAADVNTGIRSVFTNTVSGCIVHTKFHCHRCPPFSIQGAAVMELGKMLYSLM